MWAFAYASGKIGFGAKLEMGSLPIATGPERTLKKFISVASRHAYDGKTLLVPGVPEAKDHVEAFEALRRWGEWLYTRHPRNCRVYWPTSPEVAP